MTKRIKLMADYESFPLWDVDEVGNLNPDELPLSQETKERLERWADRYDATLNRQDPLASGFASPSEEAAFEEEGRALWKKLEEELGAEFRVLYYSQAESRLLEKEQVPN